MTFSEASMLLIIRECYRPSLIWLQANPRCLAFLPLGCVQTCVSEGTLPSIRVRRFEAQMTCFTPHGAKQS